MPSISGWAERFTLVVPTYNRHADLERLLVLLARQRAGFPILLLDSSAPETQAANAAMARRLGLAVTVESFDASTPPFEKFAQGAARVSTDFAALCADDDVVVAESLPRLIDFLARHDDYSAAHGWYFSFELGRTIEIPGVVYRGASIEAAHPLRRLHDCFRRYEALTYAVYRADVLKQALAEACRAGTMMERELLGGAVAAIAGKVARLPLFYYGRSLAPSHAYGDWHPVNFLASQPAAMFENYPRYRAVLIEALRRAGCDAGAGDVASILDLIHLRYLSDYAKPAVLDELIDGRIEGRPMDALVKHALPLLVDGRSPLERFARRSAWVRELRNRFFPRVKLFHLKSLLAQTTIESRSAAGVQRRYRFGRDFMNAIAEEPQLRNAPVELARLLDAYA